MTPEDAAKMLTTLAPICKAEGIRRLRLDGLELEFGGGTPDSKSLEMFQRAFEGGQITDEDALRYSEPGYILSSERQTQAGKAPA